MFDIKEKLSIIWNENYIKSLPRFIEERGFNFSENNLTKDILITGINPSFRSNESLGNTSFDFQVILNDSKWDNYWGPLKKLIIDNEKNINLGAHTAYLDIFYFRERSQIQLKKDILSSPLGVRFLVDQLNLTQHIIEDIIQPKLIIVKNKESAAYWGRYHDVGVWMGYKFDFVESFNCGELFKISGFIDSNERIASEIINTRLNNTLVLFTGHINQYTQKDKKPLPSLIKSLYERSLNS